MKKIHTTIALPRCVRCWSTYTWCCY